MRNISRFALAVFLISFSDSAIAQMNPRVASDLSMQGHAVVGFLSLETPDGDMELFCNSFAAFYDKTLQVYRFLSSAHCVLDKNKRLEIGAWYVHFEPPGSTRKKYVRADMVVTGDPAIGFDFVVFDVPIAEISDRDMPLLPFGSHHARVGEEVLMVANTSSISGTPIHTHLGRVTLEDLEYTELVDGSSWNHIMTLKIDVARGASGAPIVSVEQNAIVGILLGKFNATTAAAIPIDRFLQFWRRVCSGGEYAKYRQIRWRDGDCALQTGR